jgi:exonuclease III
MKIAGFNINNVNKRPRNLTAWLRAAILDAVRRQERRQIRTMAD